MDKMPPERERTVDSAPSFIPSGTNRSSAIVCSRLGSCSLSRSSGVCSRPLRPLRETALAEPTHLFVSGRYPKKEEVPRRCALLIAPPDGPLVQLQCGLNLKAFGHFEYIYMYIFVYY